MQSLIAQGSEFPLKKPAGFHWDFFLLGITTFVAGLLGLPAPNGLIPQAPMHTASLVVMGYSDASTTSSMTMVSESESEEPRSSTARDGRDEQAVELSELEQGESSTRRTQKGKKMKRSLSEVVKKRKLESEANKGKREIPIAVVEQRVSNLAQGCFCKSKIVL